MASISSWTKEKNVRSQGIMSKNDSTLVRMPAEEQNKFSFFQIPSYYVACLIIYCLIHDAVAQTIQHLMIELMNNKMERIWKKVAPA